MKKNGFSLIELVLSIVVIAIALMTVPLMLGQSAKSNQYTMIQESILASRTKVGNILSYQWDQNATDGNSSSVVRVIDTHSPNPDLNRSNSGDKNRRRGHIAEDLRRRMTDTPVFATLGKEGSDFDDIDDFDGESAIVAAAIVGQEGKFDYMDSDLNLTTKVRFISDDVNYSDQNITFSFDVSTATSNVAQSTSIKMIEINATSAANKDYPFVFRTFSSNIGQTKFYERVK